MQRHRANAKFRPKLGCSSPSRPPAPTPMHDTQQMHTYRVMLTRRWPNLLSLVKADNNRMAYALLHPLLHDRVTYAMIQPRRPAPSSAEKRLTGRRPNSARGKGRPGRSLDMTSPRSSPVASARPAKDMREI